MLGASLEVDQCGPFVDGEVEGNVITFLVDTGAPHSTVRTVEIPNLPLSGDTIQVVGISNQLIKTPVTKPMNVHIGDFRDSHRFVVCDTSPVNLLGRDLLCKMNCTICCTPDGIAFQTQDEDIVFKLMMARQGTEGKDLYPLFTAKDLPVELRDTMMMDVWDFSGKDIGLMKGVYPIQISVKQGAEFPKTPQYKMSPETIAGVTPVIDLMIEQGILKEILGYPCNSPIMGLRNRVGNIE